MGIFDSLLGKPDKTTAKNHASGNTTIANAMPNPFFKAMNQETVTDIRILNEGKLGSFLRRHGKIKGEAASVIDATLDYFLGSNTDVDLSIPEQLRVYRYEKNFIPIIMKTEFNYSGNANDAAKSPLYIIFDSTPDSFSFSKSANWTPKSILGRPEPVYTFQDSSSTTLTLTGDFFVNAIDEHKYKLKLSDHLMSLVTPSRDHFMPSPIMVIIGEWKQFRAIVNNVTIDYKGPWFLRDEDAKIQANKVNLAADIPTHAPYFFTATISLTLVSEDNNVSYAEDVINNAVKFNIGGANDNLSDTDIVNIKKQIDSITPQTTKSVLTSGMFIIENTNAGYRFKDGKLTQEDTYKTKYNKSYQYSDGKQDRAIADVAVITNSISTQLSKYINKKLSVHPKIGKFF